ncbi:MAG: NAD(P)-dependent oxidoreductase, partial [Pseudomonadota bacterium]
MLKISIDAAEAFYKEVIETFERKYPTLDNNGFSLIKVLHAFSDKVPLVRALTNKGLLAGLTLKRSSSTFQPSIVAQIYSEIRNIDIVISPTRDFYRVQKIAQQPVVIGDHGGYFASTIPELLKSDSARLLGITEHTVNGENRIEESISANGLKIPFLSSARSEVKNHSDTKIALNIVQEIVSRPEVNINKKVCIVGYGTMGRAAAIELTQKGFDVHVFDTNSDRNLIAEADDVAVSKDLQSALSSSDIIILATDTIKGHGLVLDIEEYSVIKDGAVLTSMTSIDDEIDMAQFKEYGQHINLLYKGCAPNNKLTNGGADDSIYFIEAIGIASAFEIAGGRLKPQEKAQELS